MSLADRLTTAAKGGSNQGLECSIAVLLRDLTGDDRQELVDALADTTVGHLVLERAIKAEGHYIGTGTVGKHRRGDCRCGKAST